MPFNTESLHRYIIKDGEKTYFAWNIFLFVISFVGILNLPIFDYLTSKYHKGLVTIITFFLIWFIPFIEGLLLMIFFLFTYIKKRAPHTVKDVFSLYLSVLAMGLQAIKLGITWYIITDSTIQISAFMGIAFYTLIKDKDWRRRVIFGLMFSPLFILISIQIYYIFKQQHFVWYYLVFLLASIGWLMFQINQWAQKNQKEQGVSDYGI